MIQQPDKTPIAPPRPVHPLFSIGFRPFFLSATLAAMLLVPAWLVVLSGSNIVVYWSPMRWHSHEMLFGYTMAVIAGFLLTAASNWTKVDVASGRPLMGLNALWLLGRVLPLVPGIPRWLVLAIDMSFLPALAFFLGRAMLRTNNRRNYVFIALLSVLTVANGLYHLEEWGVGVPAFLGRNLALRMIAIMILVMGGRIIPMFTRNATEASGVRNIPWLDKLAIASVLFSTLAEALALEPQLLAASWCLAGALNMARMFSWGVLSARAPLLWVLHLGYFATALSFVLEGLLLLGIVPAATAVHCFTIGGLGLITLGMMARVSLGHTGRTLVVPSSVSLAFALVVLAALVRVLVPMTAPSSLALSWHISGSLWAIAFALFFRFALPLWLRPRVN